MNKKIIVMSLCLLMVFSLVSSVFAITGAIGNGRMILRAETGDTIERYVLVKNTNDVVLNIEVSASGDLEDDVEVIDESFTLEPNTDKKAYFKIDVKEEGTTETKINIMFAPEDGGNGVGLSSTIIIIASGESIDDPDDGPGVSVTPGDNPDDNDSIGDAIGLDSRVIWGLSITGAVLLIFLVLLVVALSYRKNGVGKVKPKKSVRKK